MGLLLLGSAGVLVLERRVGVASLSRRRNSVEGGGSRRAGHRRRYHHVVRRQRIRVADLGVRQQDGLLLRRRRRLVRVERHREDGRSVGDLLILLKLLELVSVDGVGRRDVETRRRRRRRRYFGRFRNLRQPRQRRQRYLQERRRRRRRQSCSRSRLLNCGGSGSGRANVRGGFDIGDLYARFRWFDRRRGQSLNRFDRGIRGQLCNRLNLFQSKMPIVKQSL